MAALAVPATASAATKTWTGGAAGQWNVDANWSGNAKPTAADDVQIGDPFSTEAVTLATGADAKVRSVSMGQNTSLVVDGRKLTLTTGSSFLATARVKGGGTLELDGGPQVSVITLRLGDSSGATTTGAIRVTPGSDAGLGEQFGVPGVLEDGPGLGSLTIESGAILRTLGPDFTVLSFAGRLINHGTFNALQLAILQLTAPSSSDGLLSIDANKVLGIRPKGAATFAILAGGSVTGAGQLEISPADAVGGTISVANGATFTPGKLRLSGSSNAVMTLDLAPAGTTGELLMTDGGTRTGAGKLTVSGPATVRGGNFAGGQTELNGTLALEDTANGHATTSITKGATLTTTGATTWNQAGMSLGNPGVGSWENSGQLSITPVSSSVPSPPFLINGGGILHNTGTITKLGSAILGGNGNLVNDGTIAIDAGTFGSKGLTFGTVTQPSGLTTIAGGATLAEDVTLNGGVLRGSGTVQSLANTAGTVQPGSSPGTLTVTGNYSQGSGGTLQSEIAGSGAGQFDVLAVGGTATLNGTLAIANDPAFTPALTDTFGVLTAAGGRSGTFAALTGAAVGTLHYLDTYPPGGVTLCVVGGTATACGQGGGGAPPPGPTGEPPATATATTTTGATVSPPATVAQSATLTPAKPALTAADVLTFPSARRCASRRSFRIRLRTPRGVAVTSATVRVNGKKVQVVRGARLRAPVNLRTLPKGRFTVAIAVTLADGRTITGTRKYRTCTRKRPGHKRPPV